MKVKTRQWETQQQAEWRVFSELMLSGLKESAEQLLRTMTDAGNVEGARRWLFGPTAAQKRDSTQRRRLCNDAKTVEKEVAFMVKDKGFLSNNAL